MWKYMKMLEYPVNIKSTNPKLAMAIISQLGGPNGEKGASTRYLSQRYVMPNNNVVGVLTDVGVSVSELHISDEMCNIKCLSLIGSLLTNKHINA